MCNQGYLRRRAERIFLLFKSIGAYALFPVVIVSVLLPVINYLTYRKFGTSDELLFRVLQLTQLFIPFCSVWWNTLILRNFLGANGTEALFFYRSLLGDSVLVFCVCVAEISLLYLAYSFFLPNMFAEFLRMVCVCTVFFGFAFFAARLSGSITAPIMTTLLYTVLNVAVTEKIQMYPFYYDPAPVTINMFLFKYIPLFFTGVILAFAGSRIKKLTS